MWIGAEQSDNCVCQENSCVNKIETKCSLKPDPGTCKAYIIKYFFDQSTGRCEEFIWGGCSGVVPFETLAECQMDCENTGFLLQHSHMRMLLTIN